MAYRDRFRSIGESSDYGYDPSAISPSSILERPIEALYVVANETGGEVSTARKTATASLGRIGDRLRLTYQAERPNDGQIHRVEVRLRSDGLKLLAPRQVRSPTPQQIAVAGSGRARVGGHGLAARGRQLGDRHGGRGRAIRARVRAAGEPGGTMTPG